MSHFIALLGQELRLNSDVILLFDLISFFAVSLSAINYLKHDDSNSTVISLFADTVTANNLIIFKYNIEICM